MAVHTHHLLDDHDQDAVLWDGCEECEERSRKGVSGLLKLDGGNLELLWRRCLNTEYGGPDLTGGAEAGEYRSEAESRLGHELYLIGCLLQRSEDVWHPERFSDPRSM